VTLSDNFSSDNFSSDNSSSILHVKPLTQKNGQKEERGVREERKENQKTRREKETGKPSQRNLTHAQEKQAKWPHGSAHKLNSIHHDCIHECKCTKALARALTRLQPRKQDREKEMMFF